MASILLIMYIGAEQGANKEIKMLLYSISLIDVAFVCVVLLFAWAGCQKGFAAQVAPILTLAAFGGILFFIYPPVFDFLKGLLYTLSDTSVMWIILGLVLILAGFLFVSSNKLFARILKAKVTNGADRAWGLCLGLIRGMLVALLVLILFIMVGPRNQHEILPGKSYVGNMVYHRLVPRIQPHFEPSEVGDKIDLLRNKLLEQEDAGTQFE